MNPARFLVCLLLCLIVDDDAYKQLNTLNASAPKKQTMQVTPVQLADGTWALDADILEPGKPQDPDKTWAHYQAFVKTLPQRDVKADEFAQNYDDTKTPPMLKPIPK